MAEIAYPEDTIYWVARNSDGSVLHHGHTEPDQVTTTGQPTFVVGDETSQLSALAPFVDQFPELPDEGWLEAGNIYRHDDVLYKVIQSHDRTLYPPHETPALFLFVSEDEWPAWVQPQGGHDAYQTGDKVTHNSKKWVSTLNANVWEPGVFGWEETQ